MSLIKAIKAQLGLSNTATNNFTLTAEAADGSMKLARGNAGATTQDILTVDASGNVSVPGNLTVTGTASMGSAFGFRNKIINGAFNVWQRGTTFTLVAGVGQYVADRWIANVSGANATLDHAGGSGKLAFFGAASVTSPTLIQRIEAVNCYKLAGKSVTVSGVANNTSSGFSTVTVHIWRNITKDVVAGQVLVGNVVVSVPATSVDTPFSATFSLPSSATLGLTVEFITSGSFGAGAVLVYNDIQLEEGTVATPFEQRPYGLELSLCQRYYERGTYSFGGNAYAAGATFAQWVPYKVTKRTAPTPTASGTSLTNVSSYTADNATVDGYRALLTPTGAGAWAATSSVVDASAEL